MGKIKQLFLLKEEKEIIKLVFDKNSFTLLGDAGVSKEFSEEEIVDLLNKLNIQSSDELVDKAKSLKTHQAEFEMDTKEVKKLNLK